MRFKLLFLALVLTFVLGWFSSYVYSNINFSSGDELPSFGTKPRPSPYDRVKESQIDILDDKVIINVPNVQWSSYADTHSMEPVLRAGANGLELIPRSEYDIHVGDIVAYESNLSDGLIVHRIIESGRDEQGIYYLLKGDNNSSVDPGRVRFFDIKYVLIGVIY